MFSIVYNVWPIIEETIVEYIDVDFTLWLSWLLMPLLITFLLPLVIVLLLYSTSIILYIYKLHRVRLRNAYGTAWQNAARYIVAALWDAHGWIWHGYEIVGLENIPQDKPVLFIYYHGAIPIDLYYFTSKVFLFNSKLVHTVADRFLFNFPGFSIISDVLKVIPGTVQTCSAILKEGNMLSISPGGVYEAQFGDSYYELMWKKRMGFAKVALDAKVIIVPFFTRNIREAFRTVSWGRRMWLRIYTWIKFPLAPVYGGFPVKLVTYVGKPIPYDGNLTPEELQLKIAAKINPAGANNQDSKLKRPLEDSSEPEAKKMASIVADPLIGIRGGPTSSSIGDSGSQGSRPVSSSVGGICNEDIRVPDKMVGLIIGRGGEQITRLQSETGCKIQMAPESGGLPERVCTLTGSREAVNRAKELVLSIVNQRSRSEGIGDMNMSSSSASTGSGGGMMGHPGFVEIMIPGPKVGLIIGKGGETIKQLQEKSGAKMVVIQEGPSQEQEKPLRITGDPQKVEYAKQLVYELIAEKEMQMFHRGGRSTDRTGNYSNDSGFNHGPATSDGVEVLVPRAAVGVVIGKGGDMIKKIQAESGAKVQFQQGREDGPGDRKCLLSGKHQAVEQARQRIQELIDSVMRRDDGRNNMGGRGGLRGNGFGGNRNPNEYGNWDRRQGGPMQDKIETTFTVPSSKCGIIIGKGGETIKQINQQTGAHCELDRRNQSNENEKIFIIRGNPEQVEHAKRIFSEKLGMGPAGSSYAGAQGAVGYNPNWNTGYQAWPSQPQSNDGSNANQAPVQVNPQTGQPDYSAQWAEYYRSLGMHREADMIEQQAKQGKQDHNQQGGNSQNQSNPATTGSAGPSQQQQQQQTQQQQQAGAAQNGGQADYSVQWAEYYRSIGKIKEAEAIEAQMKAGKLGLQGNQMAQQQMQTLQGQSAGPPGTTPNAFPQTYGSYPTMNAGSAPGGYYAANAGSNSQPQTGQQNPSFPTGYQNYPYSQTTSEN